MINIRIALSDKVIQYMDLAQAYESIDRSKLVRKAINEYLRNNDYLDIEDEITFNQSIHGSNQTWTTFE